MTKILTEVLFDGSMLIKGMRRIEQVSDRGFSKVEQSINRVDSRMARAAQTAANFGFVMRRSLTLLAGGAGLHILSGFVDQTTEIRNALRQTGDDSDVAFAKMYAAANRSLSGMTNMTAAVMRFHKALKDTQSIDETIRQMETLNKLMAIGGKSQQERQSAVLQLSQALQADRLSGEELRAVREAAPVELLQAISRRAGGTIKDLKDLGTQGLLTRETIVGALRDLETEADARFRGVRVSISDSVTVFKNGALVFSDAAKEATGAQDLLVTAFDTAGSVMAMSGEALMRHQEALSLLIPLIGARGLAGAFNKASGAVAASTLALKAEEIQANRNVEATARRVASLREERISLGLKIAEGERSNISDARMARLKARLTNVERKYTLAIAENTAALSAQSLAQSRVALTGRAMSAVKSVASGIMGILGGLPGVLILSAVAAYKLYQNLRDVAGPLERAQRALQSAEAQMSEVQRKRADQQAALTKLREAESKALADMTSDERDALSVLREKVRLGQADLQLARLKLQALRETAKNEADTAKSRLETLTRGDRTTTTRHKPTFSETFFGMLGGAGTAAQVGITETTKDLEEYFNALAEAERQGKELTESQRDNLIKFLEWKEATKGVEELDQSIRELRNGATVAGSVLSEVPAKVAADADKIRKEFDKLMESAGRIGVNLSGLYEGGDTRKIEEGIDKIKAKALEAKAALEAARPAVLEQLAPELASVNSLLDDIESGAIRSRAAVDALGGAQMDAVDALSRAQSVLDMMREGVPADLAADLAKLVPSLDQIAASGAPERAADMRKELVAMGLKAAEVEATIDLLKNGSKDASSALKDLESAASGIRSAFESGDPAEISDAMDEIGVSADKAKKIVEDLGGVDMQDLPDEVRKLIALLGDLRSGALRAKSALLALGDSNAGIESEIAVVQRQIALVKQGMSAEVASTVAAAEPAVQAVIGSGDGGIARAMRDRIARSAAQLETLNKELDRLTAPPSSGGGGSTKTDAVDTLKEALSELNSVWDSTRTRYEEEQAQAVKLADARRVLVQAYGEESDAVKRLDEARQRLTTPEARRAGSFVNELVQAVDAADNLTDALQNVLAKALELNGVKFFSSLFSGNSLVSSLGTLFSFATGGVMGPSGSIPLQRYASGGVAASPQLAMFGEGSRPEAYVPLPDGRTIPVTIRMPDAQRLRAGSVASRGGVMVNAPLNVSIDRPGASKEELLAELQPRLRQHQQDTIEAVREATISQPGFLS